MQLVHARGAVVPVHTKTADELDAEAREIEEQAQQAAAAIDSDGDGNDDKVACCFDDIGKTPPTKSVDRTSAKADLTKIPKGLFSLHTVEGSCLSVTSGSKSTNWTV